MYGDVCEYGSGKVCCRKCFLPFLTGVYSGIGLIRDKVFYRVEPLVSRVV